MTHSGGKAHNVGDRGQRFEVTYFDGAERKVFGWASTAELARALADCVDAHPRWDFPQVRDRMVPA